MSLKMKYAFFTAMRTSPMLAIRNAHAFDLSCSKQLMVTNQNAHACRLNSIVAKKRMPRSLADCHDQDDVLPVGITLSTIVFLHLLLLKLFCLVLLGLPLFVCSRTVVLERFLTKGHEDRDSAKADLLVTTIDHCFGVPGHSRISGRHGLEVPPWDLWRPLGLGKLAGLSPLTELRFLARAIHLPFFLPLG